MCASNGSTDDPHEHYRRTYHNSRNTVHNRVNRWQVCHWHRMGDPSMVRLSVHALSLAGIPPPTAPLTTTATDSVGCHTRTNFARVGGRRDLVAADPVTDPADQIENNNTNKLKKLHKSYTKKRQNKHGHALDEVQSLQIENKRSKAYGSRPNYDKPNHEHSAGILPRNRM